MYYDESRWLRIIQNITTKAEVTDTWCSPTRPKHSQLHSLIIIKRLRTRTLEWFPPKPPESFPTDVLLMERRNGETFCVSVESPCSSATAWAVYLLGGENWTSGGLLAQGCSRRRGWRRAVSQTSFEEWKIRDTLTGTTKSFTNINLL